MRVGPAPTFAQTGWEPYATSKTLTVSGNEATVYALFRDGAGNLSAGVCGRTDQARCLGYAYQIWAPLASVGRVESSP